MEEATLIFHLCNKVFRNNKMSKIEAFVVVTVCHIYNQRDLEAYLEAIA